MAARASSSSSARAGADHAATASVVAAANQQALEDVPRNRIIYFMSAGRDVDGGGDLDLYESRLQKTGAAGLPTSLGPTINTDRAENPRSSPPIN